MNSTAPHMSSGFLSRLRLLSAATTNATLVKAGATAVGFIHVTNTAASARFLKIYDKVTAPTVGTDTPAHTFAIPAGYCGSLGIPHSGLRLNAGFGLAITGAIADTDTTAIAANEVIVNGAYI